MFNRAKDPIAAKLFWFCRAAFCSVLLGQIDPMLVTVDTSSIPAESFGVIARKNATNRVARRCPVADPSWLTTLLADGRALQLEDVVLQAGRHFSDRVNRQIFTSNPSRRQAATAIAWTILSLVAPSVTNSQLFVSDPLDGDIKGLCSEILGVGLALEILRKCAVIDGRTITKLAGSFDYEANGRDGGGRIKIEAKGTSNDASTSDHRTSIWKKINGASLPRGYDSAIGIIASLWTVGQVRDFDIEVCDPERQPENQFEVAVREIIRFYARRFDESTGIPEGTDLLFSVASNSRLFVKSSRPILPQATRDSRKPVSILYHNRVSIRRLGIVQEFWGRIWEPRKLPIPLKLEGVRDPQKLTAFMGIDSAIFGLIRDRNFKGLVSYSTNDEGLWRAEGTEYRAVFSVDSYGIVRGLIEGELPMEVDAE